MRRYVTCACKHGRTLLAVLPVLIFLSFRPAVAADFSVNPIRLFPDARHKTNVLAVKNNSDQRLSLQVAVYSWSQDEEAKDVFSPTEDLIVFPRILNIDAGNERLIRVGIKAGAGEAEKAYRIYLEEIPEPQTAPPEETAVRTVMKVGVPVFMAPVKTEVKGSVEGLGISAGELFLVVKNTGNVHFIIRGVDVEGVDSAGASVFKTELAGWYLHSVHSRRFSLKIPEDVCAKIKSIKIGVNTDKLSFEERMDVEAGSCSH